MKKLLSIIIPVYGVERYIEECMRSITCQITEEVEVIVVNDGTLDRSIEIAKDVVSELPDNLQSCFIFLDQENQGQSVARNFGISKSTGEFIGFLDSDDFLIKSYFLTLIKLIRENKSIDVIHFNAKQFDDDNKELLNDLVFIKKQGFCINDNKYRKNLYLNSQWYPWLRVFRSSIMKKYYFPEGMYMEDKILFPEIYSSNDVKKILELKVCLVCYRHRVGSSIRNGYSEKLIKGIDFGIEKYSKTSDSLELIVYYQFLLQKISILIGSGADLKYLKIYLKGKRKFKSLSFDNLSIKILTLNLFFSAYYWLYKFKKSAEE